MTLNVEISTEAMGGLIKEARRAHASVKDLLDSIITAYLTKIEDEKEDAAAEEEHEADELEDDKDEEDEE